MAARIQKRGATYDSCKVDVVRAEQLGVAADALVGAVLQVLVGAAVGRGGGCNNQSQRSIWNA